MNKAFPNPLPFRNPRSACSLALFLALFPARISWGGEAAPIRMAAAVDFPDLPPSMPSHPDPGPAPALPSLPSAQPSRSVYGLLWLDIDSEKADIALDGLYLDQDVWLISIAPGDHEIRVRKAGFKAYESRFDISAGQNLHLDVHLEPATDSLARRPS